MMTIMGKRFTNRGVSVVIASLLLIAIAVVLIRIIQGRRPV